MFSLHSNIFAVWTQHIDLGGKNQINEIQFDPIKTKKIKFTCLFYLSIYLFIFNIYLNEYYFCFCFFVYFIDLLKFVWLLTEFIPLKQTSNETNQRAL